MHTPVRSLGAQLVGSGLKMEPVETPVWEEQEIREEVTSILENERSLRCHYHLDKPITNFCDQHECILPMCPECVQVHSNYHQQQRQSMNFKTLDSVLTSVLQNIHQQLGCLQNSQQQASAFREEVRR